MMLPPMTGTLPPPPPLTAFIRSKEPEEAEAEWVDTIIRLGERTTGFAENCTPGYYNNEGQPGKRSRQNSFFFGGPTEFIKILKDWRADGEMKGLELG